jgi:hypothetical protein
MESEFEHLFQDLNKTVKDLEHEIAFRDWDMVLDHCGEIQVLSQWLPTRRSLIAAYGKRSQQNEIEIILDILGKQSDVFLG